MNEEQYKSIISVYQQRSFDLFNANVMLETQIEQLKKKIEELSSQLSSLTSKENSPEDF
jgi:dynactin complex subunit